MVRFKLNPAVDPSNDPQVMKGVANVAGKIAYDANVQTTAKIGITYEIEDDFVRVGPTGAAAIPLEVGTRFQPAKRMMKRALDDNRIR